MYCLFCQRYNKYRHICLACRTGFINWVKTHIEAPDGSTCSITLAAHKYLQSVATGQDILIDNTHASSDNPPEWPGFYHGNNKWVIPHNPIKLPEPVHHSNAVKLLTAALPRLGN